MSLRVAALALNEGPTMNDASGSGKAGREMKEQEPGCVADGACLHCVTVTARKLRMEIADEYDCERGALV
ncbi:hypothetical protein B0G83_113162 [Paraburkholderia sp. BL21I4N1]|nr:hypothetical protein B0G83_113162 [Paraburkholderia sp. BL21I4N1]